MATTRRVGPKPLPEAESPLVGEKRVALLESIRHYVVTVNGSIRREVKEHNKKPSEVAEGQAIGPLSSSEGAPDVGTMAAHNLRRFSEG